MDRGDVVVLKSGGPKMTVRATYPTGNVDCVWFDRETEKTGSYHKDMLLKCPKPGTVVPTSRILDDGTVQLWDQ